MSSDYFIEDAFHLTRMKAENERLESRLKSLGGVVPKKMKCAVTISEEVTQELAHKIELLKSISAHSEKTAT